MMRADFQTGATSRKGYRKYWWAIFLAIIIVIDILTSAFAQHKPAKEEVFDDNGKVNSYFDERATQSIHTEHLLKNLDDIRQNSGQIYEILERNLPALSFDKLGAIYTPTNEYLASNMKADMYDCRLGDSAYVFLDQNGNCVELVVPVYFNLQIYENIFFSEQTLTDVIGVVRLTDLYMRDEGTVTGVLHPMEGGYYTTVATMENHRIYGRGYAVEPLSLI